MTLVIPLEKIKELIYLGKPKLLISLEKIKWLIYLGETKLLISFEEFKYLAYIGKIKVMDIFFGLVIKKIDYLQLLRIS